MEGYKTNCRRYIYLADRVAVLTGRAGRIKARRVDFCEEHPDIVAAVISAWFEATNWIMNNPREASRIIGSVNNYTKKVRSTLNP